MLIIGSHVSFKNNQLYGVLDLDSTSFGRFSKEDQIIFEEIAEILVQHL